MLGGGILFRDTAPLIGVGLCKVNAGEEIISGEVLEDTGLDTTFKLG